ncbi:cleavage and polyadenylation specificity factor subunit 6-like isoform X2 [Planococcus citri]|uniref:cleavage and polyadenylation specificity factor subunit 6-like isoform X2 n=1 Tax=Planococcus citri TaxID=170843 RepID=UPI0031F7300E
MADGVDIDLYADDLEQDFAQEFAGESVDLYDDVIAGGSSANGDVKPQLSSNSSTISNNDNALSHAPYSTTNGAQNPLPIKRFQLYVGNLTWWTSDQDITEAVHSLGITDFLDVKFFENRANGQSKGFCVISLASEASMRQCLEKLPKKELYGQCPAVTYPTKQALNQFEAQSKTRSAPPATSNSARPQHPQPPPQVNNAPRMMMPPQQQPPPQQQQQQLRGRMPGPGMPGGPPMQGGPRMPGPPPPHQMVQGMPPNAVPNHQPPPGFHQGNAYGARPGMMPQGMPPQNRPMPPGMFQGPPPVQGMRGPPPGPQGGPPQVMHNDPRAPRPDWNRPPGAPHQPGGPNFHGHQQGPPMQGLIPGQGPMGRPPGHLGGPPVHGMPPGAQGPPPHGPPQQLPPAPHVNPAFFQQPQQHQTGQHVGHGYGSQSSSRPYGGGDAHREHHGLAINEQEFEEIMSRNRTVSSSAITRAVADAAAGEYASAIETLVTAISLIKQSKVSGDDRCKILISSLQDTLHGIETKSYGHSRRDRSRSRDRDRYHKRTRRDRSRSRDRDYRDRSRERDRDREREKESSTRVNVRNRAKSPTDTVDPVAAGTAVVSSKSSSSRYYDDRYRDRDRDRERDRDRDRDRESRHVERERDRERREERGESSHRTSRH